MTSSLLSHHDQVIQYARSIIDQHPVYLDTETTGLSSQDEIIEFSIIDHDGSLLFSRLMKPTQPIPAQARLIHGISDADVAAEKTWPLLWSEIRAILYGRVIAAYNSPFDLQLMQQTHRRYGLPWRDNFNFVDVMSIFSSFRGVRDPVRGGMRMFKLADAASFLNISIHETHRATADTLLTRAVLHSIAGLPY